MKLRVAIVDDEPLAREGLRIRLSRLPDISIEAECGNAADAVTVIAEKRPDVVFMDIQMPELDGFGVLSRLDRGPLPAVIFVTARADRAIEAFRTGAIDYLVKPYDDATLRESVERARTYVAMARGAAPTGVTRLTVKSNGRVFFVPVAQIDWIESNGDLVRLHVGTAAYDYHSTMRDLEEQLDPAQFVRIHRTAIVATRVIAGLEPYSVGEHLVVLRDGTKLPLSRRARARVTAAVGP